MHLLLVITCRWLASGFNLDSAVLHLKEEENSRQNQKDDIDGGKNKGRHSSIEKLDVVFGISSGREVLLGPLGVLVAFKDEVDNVAQGSHENVESTGDDISQDNVENEGSENATKNGLKMIPAGFYNKTPMVMFTRYIKVLHLPNTKWKNNLRFSCSSLFFETSSSSCQRELNDCEDDNETKEQVGLHTLHSLTKCFVVVFQRLMFS